MAVTAPKPILQIVSVLLVAGLRLSFSSLATRGSICSSPKPLNPNPEPLKP